jgi:hypothetical protein
MKKGIVVMGEEGWCRCRKCATRGGARRGGALGTSVQTSLLGVGYSAYGAANEKRTTLGEKKQPLDRGQGGTIGTVTSDGAAKRVSNPAAFSMT